MTIETLDLRLTHIETSFKEIKQTVEQVNTRVDQIYNHLIGAKQNSKAQSSSWKQWAGATIISLIGLLITVWNLLGGKT